MSPSNSFFIKSTFEPPTHAVSAHNRNQEKAARTVKREITSWQFQLEVEPLERVESDGNVVRDKKALKAL
jgi:hypothetical protein